MICRNASRRSFGAMLAVLALILRLAMPSPVAASGSADAGFVFDEHTLCRSAPADGPVLPGEIPPAPAHAAIPVSTSVAGSSAQTLLPTPPVYTVASGDTLGKVAHRYRVSVREIAVAKGIASDTPLNTAVPSDRRISAPAPVAMTRGTTPSMKAREVMVMGRSRNRDASMAASPRGMPPRCSCCANSTISAELLRPSLRPRLSASRSPR